LTAVFKLTAALYDYINMMYCGRARYNYGYLFKDIKFLKGFKVSSNGDIIVDRFLITAFDLLHKCSLAFDLIRPGLL
jgi:hypothetical protein